MTSGTLLYRALVVAAWLSLGGCKAAEQDASASDPAAGQTVAGTDEVGTEAPGREPIMLHARIDYTDATQMDVVDSGNGSHVAVEVEEPAFRFGQGADAEYESDNDHPARVLGRVHQKNGVRFIFS